MASRIARGAGARELRSPPPIGARGAPRMTRRELVELRAAVLDAIERGLDLRAVRELIDSEYVYSDLLGFEATDQLQGRRVEHAMRLIDAARPIDGHVRADDATVVVLSRLASRPDVAVGPDGPLLVWLEWLPTRGDVVRVGRIAPDGTLRDEVAVSGAPSDCFRPRMAADRAGNAWLAFTRRDGASAGVFVARHRHVGWSSPVRVSGPRPSFNPEVAAGDDGALEVCWQTFRAGRMAIAARRWLRGRWSAIEILDDGRLGSCWDPAIAALPGGAAAAAWVAYERGSYHIRLRTRTAAGWGAVRRLTSGTDYAMHPSLAVDAAGALWVAFDLLAIQGLGGSGPTRLRRREDLGRAMPIGGLRPGTEGSPRVLTSAEVRVARVDADGLAFPDGRIADGLVVRPCGFPRLAPTSEGGLVLAYRVLRNLPLEDHYWETVAQVLGPHGWSGPITFGGSAAGPEEPAIAADGEGALLVWTADRRRDAGGSAPETLLDGVDLHLDGGLDFVSGSGSIAVGRVAGRGRALTPATRAVAESSERVEARAWAGAHPSRHRVRTAAGEYRLVWGDLHRHSLISRCLNGEEAHPTDYDRFAMDVCELDFWCLTDHAEHTSSQRWWSTKKNADLLRLDGHFVPLYGFEWTSRSGHQNVVYGDVDRDAPIFSSRSPATERPDQLWDALRAARRYPAITIPHHPGSAYFLTDWGYHDPEFLRLVEVFQACRGNYEYDGCFRGFADAAVGSDSVLEGLRRGYRFGLVASSDHGYGASYVGAYATSLDRAAVFEALHARRVFAATTPTFVLDVRVGGFVLGQDGTSDATPLRVEVFASAHEPLARLDVIRNGEVVAGVAPSGPPTPGGMRLPIRIEWTARGGTDCSGALTVSRATIVQTPYWSPSVASVSTDRVTWRSRIPADGLRDAVECTLHGRPDAVLQLDLLGERAQVDLARLVDARWVTLELGGAWLRLGRGLGGLESLGRRRVRLAWDDAEPPSEAWYYVRAISIDGEMAWSSPIWVTRPGGA